MLRDGAENVTATRLLDLTTAMVPHAEHAAITLLRETRPPQTLAATGAEPRAVDKLQYQVGEGPCLQASLDPEVVLSNALEAESRWPRFARECVTETGIRSVLSVQLPLWDRDRGALNLYAYDHDAFDSTDITTSTVLATFIALVVGHDLHERDVLHLTTALESNRQISVAIGILMAQQHIGHDDALKKLQRASSLLNRKLRDIAATVVYMGELPPVPGE